MAGLGRYLLAVLLVASHGASGLPAAPMDQYTSEANIQKFIDDAGGSFSTAVFDSAVSACFTNRWNTLYFPPGVYTFATEPQPIPFGLRLRGGSMSSTVLHKDFDGGSFIRFTATQLRTWPGKTVQLGGMGGGLEDITLWAEVGRSPGIGVDLTASPTRSPDFTVFRNLNITGDGDWLFPFFIDGSQRTTGAAGVRDVTLENVNVFKGTICALYARSAVGLTITGGGFFGDDQTGAVYITGTPAVPSQIVNIRTNMNGQLNLTNATQVTFQGVLNRLNSSGTARFCHIEGVKVGHPAIFPTYNNLVNSWVNLVQYWP